MKKTSLLILFPVYLCLINSCSPSEKNKIVESDKDEVGPGAVHEDDLIKGEKVYKMFCQMCHGDDGTMVQTGDYNLATSILDLEDIIDVTRIGRGTMMPYEAILSDEDLQAVSAYTLRLQQKQ